MGLFTKSLIILVVAVSTPLFYRQFVDDNTVKYLSSHITNYKSIDQFLRQTGNNFDSTAKQYLNKDTLAKIQSAFNVHVKPNVESVVQSVSGYVSSLQDRIETALRQAATPASKNKPKAETKRVSSPSKKITTTEKPKLKQKQKQNLPRTVNCPQEKAGKASTRLWTKNEIANYKEKEIVLAFMGLVYNVTSAGNSYYSPGKEYSMFAGRDATRAYLTGNFTHDLSDDIRDLEESSYVDLKNWSTFYEQSYPQVGRLEGLYYDSEGCTTFEMKRIREVLEKLSNQANERKEAEVVLPECNSEWNGDTKKSRVWCSKASGGIERSWSGVPRIYKDATGGSDRCVCYSEESNVDASLAKNLKVYPGCEPKSLECNL